jgi:WD40 repeat protein
MECRCILAGTDEEYLIGASDKQVRVWDRETGRYLGYLKGHADSVTGLAAHPGTNQFLSYGRSAILIL